MKLNPIGGCDMSEKEYSSGNIFQDLELENADEMFIQSRLAFQNTIK